MRDMVRALALLVRTSVKASPLRSGVAALEVIASVADMLKAVWLGMMVGGVVSGRERLVWAGVALLIATVGVTWSLAMIGAQARMTLAEKVGNSFDRRIAQLSASIPSLTHLERADFLDQLQILRTNRNVLSNGLASVMWSVNVLAMAVTAIVMAWVIDPRLLLLTLTAAPALVGARMRYRWNARAEAESATPGRLANHLTLVATAADYGRELRVFDVRGIILARLRDSLVQWRRPAVWAARRVAASHFVEEALFVAVLGVVIVWQISTLARTPAAAAGITVAIVAARQIQEAIVNVVQNAGGVADVLRTVGRVLWLEDYAIAESRRYGGRSAAPTRLREGLNLRDVSFSYHGSTRPAIDHVTVAIPAGSVVAVVGENGSGKTTLIKLLCGLYKPSAGEILIDGQNLADLDIDSWRRAVTAAFQDSARLELTAQAAIGIGDPAHIENRQRIQEAVHRASADSVLEDLPSHLSTQLGSNWEGGVDLSGGQWQKIALARSMMPSAPLLQIFDEPTAALDAQSEHDLFIRYIDNAERARDYGGITILVTHRFSTVQDADFVIVLHKGRMIEFGSHMELMELNGYYAELYGVQARGYS